jgi:hypothetical protein
MRFKHVEWRLLAKRVLRIGFSFALAVLCEPSVATAQHGAAELSYTNYQISSIPWSIHVVRVPRSNSRFEIHSLHSDGRALGLSTLSKQIATVNPNMGIPVAAINGDFYQRDAVYAGDPRGLQIAEGELISAPVGGASFWVDGFGEPHATNIVSLFQVIWPDGRITPCGLNEERTTNTIVLFTPTLGKSTHTTGGREFVLQPTPESSWLPLRTPRNYGARIRRVNESGDTALEANTMVLSVGPALAATVGQIEPESTLILSTGSVPGLRGVKTAIGGGPVLVRNGRAERLPTSTEATYEISSMLERHPRSAIGWNKNCYFLVEVDGRQEKLSAGMTLEELTRFLIELGCDDAMNLDGGGSATLWYGGKVQNSPCDGRERDIANSLVVLEKGAPAGTGRALLGR